MDNCDRKIYDSDSLEKAINDDIFVILDADLHLDRPMNVIKNLVLYRCNIFSHDGFDITGPAQLATIECTISRIPEPERVKIEV